MDTVHHPCIGEVRGKTGDGVVQFLGIKYATLQDRLAEPELLCKYGAATLDAAQPGPQVMQLPMACDIEFDFIQKSLPHPRYETSDLDGLHLNITAPLQERNDLPVFVYIHGGGFGMGSNAWEQYDQARMVRLSVDLGIPVIGVGINYRVGLPGFLTSTELRAAGYKANNGIRDQRVALHWIQKHIAGFGGDKESVTVIGQSAGGVASMLHLQSQEPLFRQLVNMSGTLLALQPLPPSVGESNYSTVVKSLNLENLSADERVRKLVNIPVSEIMSRLGPGIPLLPIIDNDIVHPGPSYDDLQRWDGSVADVLPGIKWCKRLMIGDCQFDGHIYSYNIHKDGVAKAFHESASRILPSSPLQVRALEDAYSIKSDSPNDTALRNVLKFCTDIWFYSPAVILAKGWPGPTYLYHFNEPNPWEGPWKGEATHILDAVYLFQNFNEHLPTESQEIAREFAKNVLSFTNGHDPYLEHKASGFGTMVYGPPSSGTSFMEGSSLVSSGRRDTLLQLGEALGFDTLSRIFNDFLATF